MSLPDSIVAEAEGVPAVEDLALDILGRRLPELQAVSLIEPRPNPPFVLVREVTFHGAWTADRRFIREYHISVESFTAGLESDVEGPIIHQAVENALTRSGLANDEVLDGLGWIAGTELVEPARRVADWASTDAPVQYADLPHGWARHISIHRITFKRANVGPHIYNN